MKRWPRVGCAAMACCWAAGCATPDAEKPQPLVVAFNQTPLTPESPREQGENDSTPAAVSDTVRQAVVSPAAAAATRNAVPGANGEIVAVRTTQPVNGAGGAGAGGVGTASALTLGAVVVEVNGTPIYANKVLKMIAPALAARAKDVPDANRFKREAMDEIQKNVRDLIVDEIEFATAQRNLDKQDQVIAQRLTSMWRDDQIRRYGGSLQLARQAAQQQGVDFDEMIKERYRLELRRVYFQKKEMPKIQIAADDMRQYYQKHLADRFTERDQAQFRVIKVGTRQAGSRDAARSKATDLRTRAARGEDFAQLATDFNDDSYLKKTKGDPTGNNGWIDRGSFANAQVEEAVWKLNPEQVSDLIEAPDGFYFAKLERKKGGRVRSFDEDAVQREIHKTLEAEQFNALRARAAERLRQNAIVFPDPPNFAPALEMAMQMYPQWAAGK